MKNLKTFKEFVNESNSINEAKEITQDELISFLKGKFKEGKNKTYTVEPAEGEYDITVTWEWTKKGYMPSKGDIFISIEDQDWVDNYMGGDRWSSKGQLVSQIKKHISSDAKSIFG